MRTRYIWGPMCSFAPPLDHFLSFSLSFPFFTFLFFPFLSCSSPFFLSFSFLFFPFLSFLFFPFLSFSSPFFPFLSLTFFISHFLLDIDVSANVILWLLPRKWTQDGATVPAASPQLIAMHLESVRLQLQPHVCSTDDSLSLVNHLTSSSWHPNSRHVMNLR